MIRTRFFYFQWAISDAAGFLSGRVCVCVPDYWMLREVGSEDSMLDSGSLTLLHNRPKTKPAINIHITHLVVVVICEEVFPQSGTMSNFVEEIQTQKNSSKLEKGLYCVP